MNNLRVALTSLRLADSPDESVHLVEEAIAQAGQEKADVVCFPECYVPGYRGLGRTIPKVDAKWLDDAWKRIASAAARSNVAAIVGTERIVDGRPMPTVLVIDRNGKTIGRQDKVQLDPSEDETYTPGTERSVFTVGNATLGVVICHEGWRYPETVRWAARRGAKIVFHPHLDIPAEGAPTPSGFADPKNTFHEKSMLCRAAENSIFFASVNCATGGPTTSAVAAPDGSVVAWQPYGKEGLLVADLDLDQATGYLASRCKYGV